MIFSQSVILFHFLRLVAKDVYPIRGRHLKNIKIVAAISISVSMVEVVHILVIIVHVGLILLISTRKYIEKLSHVPLHFVHKIGGKNLVILHLVIGVEILWSSAVLAISGVKLLRIVLVLMLMVIIGLVVISPLGISILVLALLRAVPGRSLLRILLKMGDIIIGSIHRVTNKMGISIILYGVVGAVDAHSHVGVIVMKVVRVSIHLDVYSTICNDNIIAIPIDCNAKGAPFYINLIMIARNIQISSPILKGMLRIIIKNVHPFKTYNYYKNI